MIVLVNLSILSYFLINFIVKFFTPPEGEVDISDLKNKALESVNNLSAVTMAQLEDALQQHKTVDLHVNLQAPTILIPENPTLIDSPMLVLDLGHLSVKTDLQAIDKKEKDNRKESDFYDIFNLALTQVKVLLVPKSDVNWRDTKVRNFIEFS